MFCIGSRSVRLAPMIHGHCGIDGNKNVNGRKRQFPVNTGGRLRAARVHAANDANGPTSLPLVSDVSPYGNRVEKVFADNACAGVFASELTGWSLDFWKGSRPKSARGFVQVSKRWVV